MMTNLVIPGEVPESMSSESWRKFVTGIKKLVILGEVPESMSPESWRKIVVKL